MICIRGNRCSRYKGSVSVTEPNQNFEGAGIKIANDEICLDVAVEINNRNSTTSFFGGCLSECAISVSEQHIGEIISIVRVVENVHLSIAIEIRNFNCTNGRTSRCDSCPHSKRSVTISESNA